MRLLLCGLSRQVREAVATVNTGDRRSASQVKAKVRFMDKCPECGGELGPADGPPLLACMSCGRVYRTDRGPGLTYTGVRYAEIKEYAHLLGVHFPKQR